VRDLGGREYVELAVRRAITEGHFPGPRILAAGRPICMTGGHGSFLGREADGPDDTRKAVREQLKAGADVIKLIATGGVMTAGVEPGSPQLTLPEMRAAIEEARKAGRRTAAHAQGSTGIADAIEAGITTIEHGIYLTDEIIASMKGKGVFLVPTLAAPAAICAGGLAAGIPEFMVRKSETVAAHHLASFQRATQAGVFIAAGADSGTPFNPHGSLLPSSSSWSSTACLPSRRYARQPPWPRRRWASRTRPAASRPAWPPTSWRWRGRPPSASRRSRTSGSCLREVR
jgi:imidazolonepropionase-like amidohydrolase